jgi:hypothetical protein
MDALALAPYARSHAGERGVFLTKVYVLFISTLFAAAGAANKHEAISAFLDGVAYLVYKSVKV